MDGQPLTSFDLEHWANIVEGQGKKNEARRLRRQAASLRLSEPPDVSAMSGLDPAMAPPDMAMGGTPVIPPFNDPMIGTPAEQFIAFPTPTGRDPRTAPPMMAPELPGLPDLGGAETSNLRGPTPEEAALQDEKDRLAAEEMARIEELEAQQPGWFETFMDKVSSGMVYMAEKEADLIDTLAGIDFGAGPVTTDAADMGLIPDTDTAPSVTPPGPGMTTGKPLEFSPEVMPPNMTFGEPLKWSPNLMPKPPTPSTPDRDEKPGEKPGSSTNNAGTGTVNPGGVTTASQAGLEDDPEVRILDNVIMTGEGVGLKEAWQRIKGNWNEMDREEKDRLSMMLLSFGGTLANTPGNFLEGFTTAAAAGGDAYYGERDAMRDRDLEDAQEARDAETHAMDMEKNQIALDEARRVLNDPTISETKRLNAANDLKLAQINAERLAKGLPPIGKGSGSEKNPTRMAEIAEAEAKLTDRFMEANPGMSQSEAKKLAQAEVKRLAELAGYNKSSDTLSELAGRISLEELRRQQ